MLGAKNAVLKEMAATLLAPGRHIISNVPGILDVELMGQVLRHMGAHCKLDGHELSVVIPDDPTAEAPIELVRAMRASIVVLGPLLARCGEARVALPGGDDTRKLIGARELDALGGGWLVNVGRGSVVDEVALVEALISGHLRGAGLDVFETEPLPADSPLWDLPSVVITPHIAGASPHYGTRLADLFRANLNAFHGHGDWLGRVV